MKPLVPSSKSRDELRTFARGFVRDKKDM